jgi:hypothetical protein
MYKNKDSIINTLTIKNTKEVSTIYNEDQEDYIHSSLTCSGGGVFNKGVCIGMQEKMNSGLLLYDNENFYGFSDKFGLVLLSNNNEYRELEIEEIKNNTLQPIQPGNTNSIENKKITLNIYIKDNPNFHIIIPNNVNELFLFEFNIQYIINDETMISKLNIIFINKSNKNIKINHIGNNLYFKKENKIINIDENMNNIIKYDIDIISNEYILISSEKFTNNN